MTTRSGEVAANEPLRVSLLVEGDLRARLKDGGQEIELMDGRGKRALSYSKLVAVDVTGRQLAARMETDAAGREISLVVDDSEASYPVTIDPLLSPQGEAEPTFKTWAPQAKLESSDGKAEEYFGNSVGISGDTAIVGSFNGKVKIYTRGADGKWDREKKLDLGFPFGAKVAISGNIAVISGDKGVYVYERDEKDNDWYFTGNILRGERAAVEENFGSSIAIDGNTVVVGAPYAYVNNFQSGAVYVFKRKEGGTWSAPQRLTAPAGEELDGNGIQRHIAFGSLVRIDNNTIIVGVPHAYGATNKVTVGPGAAYIFERSNNEADTWSAPVKLFSPNSRGTDLFGASVGISGNTAIIATRFETYVFTRRSDGTWSPGQGLGPGTSGIVAISGERAIIGTRNAHNGR